MPEINQDNTAIELHNVRFAYPDTPHRDVLEIPQWSVGEGEKLFIHGPSGSGKSTLLNLLSGLTVNNAGETRILGQRIDTLSGGNRDRFRARHIGHVFQQFNLIPYLSARENIALAQHFCSKAQAEKKSAAQNHQKIDQLLDELDIPSDERQKKASNLSVGQQQRVAIARALINQPQLLIADEPTSSLDKANSERFLAMLLRLANQHELTLLFVSHDESLSSLFDRSLSLASINRAATRK